jgi:hypothetical protein
VSDRRQLIREFYRILDQRPAWPVFELDDLYCDAELNNPGMYFFFEGSEVRENGRPRVVYAGIARAGNRLWSRIKQHSSDSDASNLVSYVFEALAVRQQREAEFGDWINKHWRKIPASLYAPMRSFELDFVIRYLHQQMSFKWVPARCDKDVAKIPQLEKGVIGLLSNYSFHDEQRIDPPSVDWLGLSSRSSKTRSSGLWNRNSIGPRHRDEWLGEFEDLTSQVNRPR